MTATFQPSRKQPEFPPCVGERIAFGVAVYSVDGVQLVQVRKTGARYAFGFARLKKFLQRALDAGFKWFELSHLFTQWGAYFTPKIMAETENGTEQIFGWSVASDSEEYSTFLEQFIPKLKAFLKKNDWLEKAYFHLSDEPGGHVANYMKLREKYGHLFTDCQLLDAESDYAMYEKTHY